MGHPFPSNTNACQSASRLGACEVAPPCAQQTLDSLIQNVVDFVHSINAVRAQAATVRERLCGAWPQEAASKTDGGINGQLDALDNFQRSAWAALNEVSEHLSVIQQRLG